VSQNITADTVRAAITPKTRAIIAVHLNGWPCDMDPIRELAKQRELTVIEDCAQAHAAMYKGRPVGSLGDVAAFSFCQDKILTTGGEGGMLTTNDESVWKRAWSYKDHGKDWDAVHRTDPSAVFKWLHGSIGTNWRMTEMQAAIGRVALGKLQTWVTARRRHARLLDSGLSGIPAIRIPRPPADVAPSYYKYYVFLHPQRLRGDWTRDRILEAVGAEGIPCGSGVCPEIYLERAFADNCRPYTRLPVARQLGQTSMMFLVHPTLSDREIEDTCSALAKVARWATIGNDGRWLRAA
jgi:dTDP-4-amino-4,6-dideoxygalactose transaminase